MRAHCASMSASTTAAYSKSAVDPRRALLTLTAVCGPSSDCPSGSLIRVKPKACLDRQPERDAWSSIHQMRPASAPRSARRRLARQADLVREVGDLSGERSELL